MTKDINEIKLPNDLSVDYYGGLSSNSISMVPVELLDIDDFSTGLLKSVGINTLSDILNMPQVLNMSEEAVLDEGFPFSRIYKEIQKKYGPLDKEDNENIHTKKAAGCKKVLADLELSKLVINMKHMQITNEFNANIRRLDHMTERLTKRIESVTKLLEEELSNPYWTTNQKTKK